MNDRPDHEAANDVTSSLASVSSSFSCSECRHHRPGAGRCRDQDDGGDSPHYCAFPHASIQPHLLLRSSHLSPRDNPAGLLRRLEDRAHEAEHSGSARTLAEAIRRPATCRGGVFRNQRGTRERAHQRLCARRRRHWPEHGCPRRRHAAAPKSPGVGPTATRPRSTATRGCVVLPSAWPACSWCRSSSASLRTSSSTATSSASTSPARSVTAPRSRPRRTRRPTWPRSTSS